MHLNDEQIRRDHAGEDARVLEVAREGRRPVLVEEYVPPHGAGACSGAWPEIDPARVQLVLARRGLVRPAEGAQLPVVHKRGSSARRRPARLGPLVTPRLARSKLKGGGAARED
mgnify:CR=1 FL=1